MVRFGILVSVLAACSSSSSIAYSDLDQALQVARCTHLTTCGLFPDEASCVAFFRETTDTSMAAAITAGKVKFDGEAAQRCVDSTAKLTCDPSSTEARAQAAQCATIYVGQVAGGEACAFAFECASGTCVQPDDCEESKCCIGTCKAEQKPSKLGGPCAKDPECDDGLVCAKDQTCHAPAKDGEDCFSDRECIADAGCIGALSTTPGSCRTLPHKGEACPYQRCADENLRCDVDNTHTCIEFGLPGAACATSADCSPYMTCDTASQMCKVLPHLGEPCAGSCQGVSFCSGAPDGMCVAPQDNGAPCTAFGQCASNFCEAGAIYDACNTAPVCT